jgi:hypothetical protein
VTAIGTRIDLNSPRTIGQILNAALRLFARQPLLFLFLAGIIVVPYEVITILVEGGKSPSATTNLLLLLAQLALVNPCIVALEMQALIDLGEARRPEIPSIIRRALIVLPVVAATEIIAGLSAGVAALFLFLPGIYVAVRLTVAAPAAATEKTNWPGAIRRSLVLTRGNSWRVFGLWAMQFVLLFVVAVIVAGGSSLGATIVGVALAVLTYSFFTLLVNILYFDLRARAAAPVA